MNTAKLAITAFSVTVAALVAGKAMAGYKATSYVTVNGTLRYASGAMGDARNSADANQYIGCSVDTMSGVSCSASDSSSNYVGCYTTDATILAAVQGYTPGAYLHFQYDASGTCTELFYEKYSWWRPMTP